MIENEYSDELFEEEDGLEEEDNFYSEEEDDINYDIIALNYDVVDKIDVNEVEEEQSIYFIAFGSK
jgi:hypothetical protein